MNFTNERNHQIIIELLKKHGICKIVTSPGGTNVTFVISVQNDPFFELYSSVDERSAAYIACGMAEESGEAVVLTCTGATAARNYYSGLTEAYYRKLPILAITSTMPTGRIGNNFAQLTDRSNLPNDIVKKSVLLPVVKDEEDEWVCIRRANDAILELDHNGKGPVHINLETTGGGFDQDKIKPVNKINRYCNKDLFPDIKHKNICIFVGSHSSWDTETTNALELFCEKYNAVVIGDHTSNYKGKYYIPASLVTYQKEYKSPCVKMDILIHLGNVSGAYIELSPTEVWRVDNDGVLCDTFKKLTNVFQVSDLEFFQRYNECSNENVNCNEYYNVWKREYEKIRSVIPELPFSNIWIASVLSEHLPNNCVLHLGILNSLRSWNFFSLDSSIKVYSNTGGFGIDGCISSLLGASLVSKDKLYFGVVGDLAFFYDMNVLGNRYWGNNIRLLVINNGIGQEFKNFGSRAATFGKMTNQYVAAEDHFGHQSKSLIKNFTKALNIKYMSAETKDEFQSQIDQFISNNGQSVVFEVFTNSEEETEALRRICTAESSTNEKAKQAIKSFIGEKNMQKFKRILKGKK